VSTSRLRHHVGEAIANNSLWDPGMRVAIAVSGGLDSMCLLDLLQLTADWHGAALSVVTVDHGTGPHAVEAAALVQEHAERMELPCVRIDVSPDGTSEDAMRRARYAMLDVLNTDRIALAHHADDLAETVLLHLIRGAGTRGMGGMLWRRERYVRPLLTTRRSELEAWATHRGLRWSQDPTNAQPRFLRNRLRAEVMPLLETLRPGASAAIARSAGHAAADDAYLTTLADALEATDLAAAPLPVARRWVLGHLPVVTSAHVDAVMDAVRQGHGMVALPRSWVVLVTKGVPVATRRKRGGG